MDWGQLRALIRAGDVAAVTAAVSGLSAPERRALAPGITVLERSVRRWQWPAEDGRPEQWLTVADYPRTGPACAVAAAGILTAAQLGPVLGRATLGWSVPGERVSGDVVDEVMAVLTSRGLAGEPGIAAPVARRVQARFGGPQFDLAYRLAVAAQGEPPTDDGFVLQWMAQYGEHLAAELSRRPAWVVLVPHFLTIRGGGQHLGQDPDLQQTFCALAADGVLGEDVLLDTCLATLQVSRRRADLLGLVALHQALAPSDDAVRARAGDYVALVVGGASFVAKVAQERLRALDGAGRLDSDIVVEVSRAVLLRPEKALVRTQLTWLRAALQSPRSDAERERLLLAIAAGFGQPDAALQARALDLLSPHAPGLSAATRHDLARESGALAPDLRARAAALFGSADPASEPVVPADGDVGPVNPPVARHPVASPTELAECLARYHQDRSWYELVDHDLIERILDALVRFSWSDREGLVTALAPVLAGLPWLTPGPPTYLGRFDGQALHLYDVISAAVAAAAGAGDGAAPPGPTTDHPPLGLPPGNHAESPPRCDEPDVVLIHRFAEVAAGLWWAPVPMLLAAPTADDGTLEAAELAHRLAAFEAARCRPWPHDLAQALLRVRPQDLPALHDAVHRIAGRSGTSLIAWLTGPTAGPGTELPSGLPATWAPLWTFTEPPHRYDHARRWSTLWAWLLPFARETIATHLVRRIRESHRGDGRLLLQFSTAHGRLGPASYLVLAHGLNLPDAADRAAATDALLTLTGRGDLEPTTLGDTLGPLVLDRALTLTRVVPALRDYGSAGAWPALWELLTATLAHCLPGPDEKPAPQLAELLALAVETAQITGAFGGTVPGLDAVAARPGRTRLRTEALRLQAALLPPP